MAVYTTTDTELTSVANAIRTKGGTSAGLVYPAGFISAIDAIPTGGGSNWELVASAEVELNVTSTSTQYSLAILNIDTEVLKDNTHYLFSRVRDTAGARPGYWVGSDQLLVSPKAGSGAIWITGGDNVSIGYITYICKSNGVVQKSGYPAKYGLWLNTADPAFNKLYYSGRYNSSGTLTINGTYSIEVYKLTLPDGKTPIPVVSTT